MFSSELKGNNFVLRVVAKSCSLLSHIKRASHFRKQKEHTSVQGDTCIKENNKAMKRADKRLERRRGSVRKAKVIDRFLNEHRAVEGEKGEGQ